MTSDQLTTWTAEARASAATPEHVWDRRALDWPLTKDSTVVEVGGYKGRWALQIAERYHPRLFVFEPQPWAYATCKAVLGERATVLNYGLGSEDVEHGMGEWETDGCSFVKPSGSGPVKFGLMREIGATFERLDITTIDLMLMNIEGYEYTLLPHMFDAGIEPDRLMVQFHEFADPRGVARAHIRSKLVTLGYQLAWDYGVLTAWERA